MLRQLIEHVALVLPPVGSPQQQMPAGRLVLPDPGIMSGGQGVSAVVQGPVQQGAELDAPVAVHAGIGGASRCIFTDETVHDLPLKQLPQIQNRVGDAQSISHAAGVGDVLLLGIRRTGAAQAQSDAEYLISLLAQQQRCSGAVHAAAHGDTHFSDGHFPPPQMHSFAIVPGYDQKEKSLFAQQRRKRDLKTGGRRTRSGRQRCDLFGSPVQPVDLPASGGEQVGGLVAAGLIDIETKTGDPIQQDLAIFAKNTVLGHGAA